MAAKFLFCLPLRLGVFIFTILQFLICGAAAGFDWFVVYHLVNGKVQQEGTTEKSAWDSLPQELKIALIVIGAVYTFAAIIGFFGFLGAVLRKTGFVATYYTLLWITFVLQLATSIWTLVVFFKARKGPREDCNSSNKSLAESLDCASTQALRDVPQGWVIAGAIVPVVLMAYALYVVHFYVKRTQKQNLEKEMRFKSNPSYVPVAGKEESHPLTQPTTMYPYRDAPNAFGPNGHANKV